MKLAHNVVVSELVDGGYSKRKKERKDRFNRTYGVKQVTCAACSGSCYYDDGRGRKCGSCEGTGKTQFPKWE